MMRGTILCLVEDNDHGRAALQAGADLSDRLNLRLVLAHVVGGVDEPSADENAARTCRQEAGARLVARLAAELGLSDRAEHRSAVGDPATRLGQIAAEEAADLIVVGAPAGGRLRRFSESRLAEHLESATTVPVVFVPPPAAKRRSARDGAGANVN
jgi:nucleotide-binding universal stress UspA family protein